MGGKHVITMSERLSNHIRPWEEHIQQPCQKGPALTYDHGRLILPPCQNGPALTSNHGRNTSKNHVRKDQHLYLTMGGTHPRTMSERLSTYIWPWEEHIQEPCHKGSTLISSHVGNTSHIHARKAQHLYLAMWRTHPTSMLERLNIYIQP